MKTANNVKTVFFGSKTPFFNNLTRISTISSWLPIAYAYGEFFERLIKQSNANNEIFCKLSTLVSGSLSRIKLLKSAKNNSLPITYSLSKTTLVYVLMLWQFCNKLVKSKQI